MLFSFQNHQVFELVSKCQLLVIIFLLPMLIPLSISMLAVSRPFVFSAKHSLNFTNSVNFSCAMDATKMLKAVRECVPALDKDSHKGQAGRIGIIGGSLEYTGAPYFAGISALKVGADLVHIFCASSAATVIKSYSPELIVHPLLDSANATKEISPWLDRLHAVVIGPGLGRAPETFKVVSELINITREKKIPLVIDADGLFLITENPELIKDYPVAVLTPNKIEFERLLPKVSGPDGKVDVNALGDKITILRKGSTDQVYDTYEGFKWQSNIGGSGRRCGGQGDILSGSIAIFLHWIISNIDMVDLTDVTNEVGFKKTSISPSLACYAASRLVRLCNEKAFKIKGRSMLASDMIEHIHESFEELFGQ